MLYPLAEFVQQFLFQHNVPASKSFYEQMLLQKQHEADIIAAEESRKREAMIRQRELEVFSRTFQNKISAIFFWRNFPCSPCKSKKRWRKEKRWYNNDNNKSAAPVFVSRYLSPGIKFLTLLPYFMFLCFFSYFLLFRMIQTTGKRKMMWMATRTVAYKSLAIVPNKDHGTSFSSTYSEFFQTIYHSKTFFLF